APLRIWRFDRDRIASAQEYQRGKLEVLVSDYFTDDDVVITAVVAGYRPALEAGTAVADQGHVAAAAFQVEPGEAVRARRREQRRQPALIFRQDMHGETVVFHEGRAAASALGQAPQHHGRVEGNGTEAVDRQAHV